MLAASGAMVADRQDVEQPGHLYVNNLSLCHFNQVTDSVYHSHHIGGVFLDNGVMHFVDAEGVEGALLHCGRLDAALYLGDFDLCHDDNEY